MGARDSIDLGVVFAEALTEVISITAGLTVAVESEESDKNFYGMTGMVSIFGKTNGVVFISAMEQDLRVLCSAIIGAPVGEVTKEDIEDMLCELMNMTVSSARLCIADSDRAFSFSMPYVMLGERMSIILKNKTRNITRVLGNGEISLQLKIIC